MKTFRAWSFAAAFVVACGAVSAQPGPGPGAGPGPNASAPRGGAAGMGLGGPGRPGGRWGSDFTPGWSMMTPAERQEHQARMRSMTSYEDCRAYRQQHQQQMAERAKERHRATLAQPRRDACAGLKR